MNYILTEERVKEIKQSFRLMMDGATAKSMRDKGSDYKLNWGVPFPLLRRQAAEIGKDYDLAVALWKEDIRECKILATLIMPADAVLPEVIDIWMEQTTNQEIAEMAAFNLYQHLPYAAQKAFEWIASENELYQLCGFHVLTRLFMAGKEPNERGINEFLDQAVTAVSSDAIAVKKAAMASIQRFSELGLVYERLATSAMKGART